VTEALKDAGAKWKTLSAAEKKPFEDISAKERSKQSELIAKYKASIPKRPLSAYMRYMLARRNQLVAEDPSLKRKQHLIPLVQRIAKVDNSRFATRPACARIIGCMRSWVSCVSSVKTNVYPATCMHMCVRTPGVEVAGRQGQGSVRKRVREGSRGLRKAGGQGRRQVEVFFYWTFFSSFLPSGCVFVCLAEGLFPPFSFFFFFFFCVDAQ
jgi:hypothetical protein